MLENVKTTTADRVEVSWDAAKNNWLVRIQAGEEAIRRHFSAPKDAEEPALRTAAQKTVEDEGYVASPAGIIIRR